MGITNNRGEILVEWNLSKFWLMEVQFRAHISKNGKDNTVLYLQNICQIFSQIFISQYSQHLPVQS